MVKHQKEKLYVSQRELRASQRNEQQQRGVGGVSSSSSLLLPFDCCALTLIPFEQPVCNRDGIMFDHHALVEFLFKHRTDPSSGKPMSMRDVIHLHMERASVNSNDHNSSGTGSNPSRWQCPVLHKPFTPHSKIVAILQPPEAKEDGDANKASNVVRRTANVYSYEAVQQLNFQPKHYVDLLSNQPFDKKRDVIWLYDPSNEELTKQRNDAMQTAQQQKKVKGGESNNSNIQHSAAGQRILDKLDNKQRNKDGKTLSTGKDDEDEEDYRSKGKKLKLFHEEENDRNDGISKKKYMTPSLTSTSASVTSSIQDLERPKTTEAEILEEQMIALKEFKTKGFVKLHTTKGPISFLLDCDIVPKTCINFLGLCAKGAYDKSPFHRLIKNFMIQGGKPKKKNTADASLWGEAFEDEFDNRLTHDRRGILSMANSGPNTNKCQFFILFRPCPHLDRKHTVFGHMVEGMEVLDMLETIPTNKNDEPLTEPQVRIDRVEVIQDPTQQAVDAYRMKIKQSFQEKANLDARRKASALGIPMPSSSVTGMSNDTTTNAATEAVGTGKSGVGKYLPQNLLDQSLLLDDVDGDNAAANQKTTKIRFSEDTKQSTANKANNVSDSAQTGDTTFGIPNRIPLPPKQPMKFGDFSGW